jgi:dipeptide/tripeptide permease
MTWFVDLRKAPREAWLLIALRPFASFGYFLLRAVLVLYLSKEHDYDDMGAAAVFAWTGFAAVSWGIAAGPLIDRLGVRRSIVIGSIIACLGMLILAFSYDRVSMAAALFVVLPIGLTMSMSAYNIGGKRYSYAGTQSVVFALLYFAMNVGASAVGGVYQRFREAWPDDHPHGGMSNERILMFVAAVLTLLTAFVAGPFLRDVRVGDDGTVYVGEAIENPIEELGQAGDNVDCSKLGWRMFYERYIKWYWDNVFTKALFWKLVAFTISLVYIGQVYGQFDATLPKFALRVIGPNAPIGNFYAINPIVIMLLVWLSPVLLKYIDPYHLQIIGSFVSAISMFIVALLPDASGISLALIAFSVGEAMYSPQTSAFVMSMSPKGHEATFGLLASVPLFFSTLAIGYSSGILLADFCPEPEKAADSLLRTIAQQMAIDRCGQIWNVVASIALVTPVLLVLFYRCIYTADVKASVAIHTHRFKTDAVEGDAET